MFASVFRDLFFDTCSNLSVACVSFWANLRQHVFYLGFRMALVYSPFGQLHRGVREHRFEKYRTTLNIRIGYHLFSLLFVNHFSHKFVRQLSR